MSKPSYRIALKLSALLAFAAAGALYIAPAHAGSASADLDMSASVSANCTISSAPVAFGAYDGISANASTPLDSSGSVTVQCTSGASANIVLGQGDDADASSSDAAPVRRMSDGTNHLDYALFSDAARTSPWGNTPLTGVSHAGSGLAAALTVYGRVAPGQNLPAGNYIDTVIATVNF